jgi:prevent-host-death family protein
MWQVTPYATQPRASARGRVKPATIELDYLAMKEPTEWRLADAKNRFSELVNRALVEGPQRVLRRDEAVVVVAERDYEKLTGTRPSFKQFLLGEGPSLERLDLNRDGSPMRKVKL